MFEIRGGKGTLTFSNNFTTFEFLNRFSVFSRENKIKKNFVKFRRYFSLKRIHLRSLDKLRRNAIKIK